MKSEQQSVKKNSWSKKFRDLTILLPPPPFPQILSIHWPRKASRNSEVNCLISFKLGLTSKCFCTKYLSKLMLQRCWKQASLEGFFLPIRITVKKNCSLNRDVFLNIRGWSEN